MDLELPKGMAFLVSAAVHGAALAGIAVTMQPAAREALGEAPGLVLVSLAAAPQARPADEVPRSVAAPRLAEFRQMALALDVPAVFVAPEPEAAPAAPAAPVPSARPAPVQVASIAPVAVAPEPLADALPRYLHAPRPEFPEAAREDEEEGVVVLRVLVSEGGAPLRVVVERSSGHRRLDAAAIAGVSRWTFQPAVRHSRAVEAWMQVPVRFALR